MPPFEFPPPPPPPPKAQADPDTRGDRSNPQHRGARGRGGRGGSRGRAGHRDGLRNHRGNAQHSGGAVSNEQLPMMAPQMHQPPNAQMHGANATPSSFLPFANPYQQVAGLMSTPALPFGGFGAFGQLHPSILQSMQGFSNVAQNVPQMQTGYDQSRMTGVQMSQSPEMPGGGQSPTDFKGHKRRLEFNRDSQSAYPPAKHQHLSSSDTSRITNLTQSQASRPDRDGVQRRPRNPKVDVAPAVPSFGAPLPVPAKLTQPASSETSAVADELQTKRGGRRKRKTNQLGLTPKGDEFEESDDDADEEAKLAASTGGSLQFEYKGLVTSLGSKDDLQAWLAERKKRYPTQARTAERKAEATRRAQERAHAQRAVNEARMKARDQKQKERTAKRIAVQAETPEKEQRRSKEDEKTKRALAKHLAKVEKLKRKLEKSDAEAARLAKVAESMRNAKADAASDIKSIDPNSVAAAIVPSDGGLASVEEDLSAVEKSILLNGHYGGMTTFSRLSRAETENLPKAHAMPLALLKNGIIGPTSTTRTPAVATSASQTAAKQTGSQEVPRIRLNGESLSPDAATARLLNHDDRNVAVSDALSDDDASSGETTTETSASSDSESDDSAPASKPSTAKSATTQPVCQFFSKHGHCRYGDKCRYRHEQASVSKRTREKREARARQQGEERGKRQTLFQRLVEQERQAEDRVLLQAMKELGDAGALDE